MVTPAIPFVDLAADWSACKAEALARIARVFDHGQFVMGPEVALLEAQLAVETGVRHALACSSGTTALQIALMALGLQRGDEVILPAFTFAAPLESVLLSGASAVLADIDPETCLIDGDSVSALVGEKTRAIIAVSLYGQPADFHHLGALAAHHDIALIEDAAQSHGATLDGKSSGSLGTIGCMSFHPTKPLGGAGDGGAVLTDDAAVASAAREIRNHGQRGRYNHVRLGLNGRLDSIACAALLARLANAGPAAARRRDVAGRYDILLGAAARLGQLRLPRVREGTQSAFAQYAVQIDRRDQVMQDMLDAGVEVAIHYPTPLHHQPAYRDRVTFRSLIHAETVSRRALCLPIYPTLTPAQQTRVAAVLITALEAKSR